MCDVGSQPWVVGMIHLYSLDTPNGQKIGVALCEMGLPFEVRWWVSAGMT